MEAATVSRSGAAAYAQAVREAVRSRSRVFWIVAGLTALAAILRFATLGLQAYHHDEIVTASRILSGSFWEAMDAVGFSESAPPLYYALAWAWTQLTGTGEVGLRSLSALAGVATVPVAFLIGSQLRGQRVGIAAAALVAVNPMMLWYSQEARAYALLVLFCALSLLYWLRALDQGQGGRRELRLWGLFSGLAMASHYFALFPIAAEAIWLLRRRGRASLAGLWIVAAFGAALAPLALHQMSYGHAEWISNLSLGHRVVEGAGTFFVGETSDIIANPDRPWLAAVPVALAVALLVLLALRGERDERRAAARPLAIAAAALGIPMALALVPGGKDFVIGRNVMAALLPLLAGLAVACNLRRARRLGAALVGALLAYSLAFCVLASSVPSFQRPPFDTAAERLGEPSGPRVTVSWTIGLATLRHYLETGAVQIVPSEDHRWFVREIDFVSDGPAPPPPRAAIGPGFEQTALIDAGRLQIRRYERRGPGLGLLRIKRVRDAELGFRTNGTLLDGIGP